MEILARIRRTLEEIKDEHVQRGRNGDLVVALETETGGDHFPSIVDRDDYTAMIFWWAFQLIS